MRSPSHRESISGRSRWCAVRVAMVVFAIGFLLTPVGMVAVHRAWQPATAAAAQSVVTVRAADEAVRTIPRNLPHMRATIAAASIRCPVTPLPLLALLPLLAVVCWPAGADRRSGGQSLPHDRRRALLQIFLN